MRPDSRLLIRVCPVPFVVCLLQLLDEYFVAVAAVVRPELLFVQNHFSTRKRGQKLANREPVRVQSRARPSEKSVNVESISPLERALQEQPRRVKANKVQICRWREGALAQLPDIESEFRAHMRVRIFLVGDVRSVLFCQLRKLDACGGIGPNGVSNRVAQIVRKRSNRKRIFIHVVRLSEQIVHEISRADVVRQLAEKGVFKWVVAHVL